MSNIGEEIEEIEEDILRLAFDDNGEYYIENEVAKIILRIKGLINKEWHK